MKRLKVCIQGIDIKSIKFLSFRILLSLITLSLPGSLKADDRINTSHLNFHSDLPGGNNRYALNTWEYVNSNGQPDARHECAYVELGGKFYLIGGRGNPSLNIFNPQTNSWSTGTNIPGGKELHHFQAVVYDNKIYIIGAFTGGFPTETPVGDIYIYDPVTNNWTVLANQIPDSRRRGAAGAVVYNNRIYIIGGIRNGHTNGWVNWMDEFNPATSAWTILPDAPHQRDHLQAVVLNNKVYVAGGRRSAYPNTINLTEASVDVFNFATQQWSTLPSSSNIPTPRAGAATVALNNELVVIAGESGNNGYHHEVEAFNPQTNTWRSMAQTNEGRNGPGGISYNGKLYIVAGMVDGSEVSSQEIFTSSVSNAAPQIISSISDVNVTINATPVNINLSDHFNDDGGAANLFFTISSNTNTSLVQAAVINNAGLQINFTANATGTASIKIKATDQQGNAVEDEFSVNISGNSSPAGSSIFINSGGTTVQFGSQLWSADKNFSGGSVYSGSGAITGTENDNIYLFERFGKNFGYAIPVATGTYTVNLHFAEIYWSASGQRVFNVNIENGKAGTSSIDIFALAGKNKAFIKSYVVQITDGILNIDFSTISDNAKIAAIEIISNNACGSVSGLTASKITTTTADISWSAAAGSSKYQAEYRKSGTAAWTVISTGITSTYSSITGLSAGITYEWRVKAYCSSGYGGYTQSSFTTGIPVANAGSDITVMLPTSSVNLTGKGTVTGGTTSGYTWTQVSGPSTAVFSSKSTANVSVSNLVAGSYVFGLIVKDNAGISSKPDQVTVFVNATSTPTQVSVTSFTLIDAATNKDILTINEGAVVNGAILPAGGVNVRANVNQVATSKVVFVLSGAQNINRSESVAPYALFGDSNGDYAGWKFANGSYTLTATPFGSNGTAATARTVHFSVANASRSISENTLLTDNPQNLSVQSAFQMDQRLTFKLDLYPNPSYGAFNAKIYGDENIPVRFLVTDISGRIIESKTIRSGNLSFGMNYKSGVYLLKLSQGAQTVLKKIIKQ